MFKTFIITITILLITTHTYAQDRKKEKPLPPPSTPANGSLFTDNARNVEVLSDFSPHQVGDIIFIDVVESSAASVSSSAKNKREGDGLGGSLLTAASAAPLATPIVDGTSSVLGGLNSRKFDGSGTTERTSELRARIAARVTEVLPNGEMRIQAEKRIKINKETEKLTLSGLIRGRDVSLSNSVPSTSVADLRVQLNGKGVASAHNAPGWLARMLGKIAPF
jgi:flagellar L-ring protein precursor FlgH